jgi:uncharacterized protein
MRVERAVRSSAAASGLVLALLFGATACGKESTTAGLAPSASRTSCRLADALHEHAFADVPELRASIHVAVVGRLETSADAAHPRDSHGPGIDAVPYRVDGDTPLRIAIGPGTVARVQLVDASGTTVADVARGGSASRIDVARGDYTLLLHGDGTRASHFVVHPEACLPSAAPAAVVAGRVAQAAPDPETPGVYVQELTDAASSIVAAPTSVAAFVGFVGTGPTGEAVLLESASDLTVKFGDTAGESLVGLAVTQFFEAGKSSAYLVGTTSAAAADLVGEVDGATGLFALGSTNGWSILVLPDLAHLSPADALTVLQSAAPVAASALAFTVIDPPAALVDAGAITTWITGALAPPALPPGFLRNAAIYFPAIDVVSPSGAPVTMGAGGVVAGLWAATDASIGVWDTPVGIPEGVLPTSIGQPVAIDDATAGILLAAGVNPIRDAASAKATSAVVGGDRTLASSAGLEASIPESRTLLMLEASIQNAFQWIVFEPNDPTLWLSVTAALTSFLTDEWQDGALVGDTAAEAFAVQCDAANNPAETRSLGELFVEVRVRLVDEGAPILLSLTFETEGPDSGA